MKALFNCRSQAVSFEPVHQGSPFLLPVCNKALLEYWLDLCVWLGIREVLLVGDPQQTELAAFCRQKHEWGLELHWQSGNPDDALPELLAQQRTFLDQDLLLVDGFHFPLYDRKQLKPLPPLPEALTIFSLESQQIKLQDTVLLFSLPTLRHLLSARDEHERFQRWTSLPLDRYPHLHFQLFAPTSLKAYYQLSLQVLKNHPRFHLKGFEVAPGVFEGINNEIEQRPALKGPLLTGELCQLGASVQLENVVLHDQVRIEGQTQLKNCLVWGPLYLGNVQLENSMIFQNQLLDPQNGQLNPLRQHYQLKELLEDPAALALQLQNDARQATRLLLWRWPLYMLLRWLVPWELKKYYLNSHGEMLILPEYRLPSPAHLWQQLFFRLSLQRVPKLLAVREQRLLLLGTRLLSAETESLHYIQKLPVYAPGAFSHHEALEPASLTHWMEELHFASQYDPEQMTYLWQESLEADRQLRPTLAPEEAD